MLIRRYWPIQNRDLTTILILCADVRPPSLKGFSRFLIKFEINTQDFKQNEIFVPRLRKNYSMKKFNSKRFLNKNTFVGRVFWIMVSRSLDVSLHFNENLTISSFLYIFWKVVKINVNRLFLRVWIFFSKVFQSYFSLVPDFGLFWMFRSILINQLISLS